MVLKIAAQIEIALSIFSFDYLTKRTNNIYFQAM